MMTRPPERRRPALRGGQEVFGADGRKAPGACVRLVRARTGSLSPGTPSPAVLDLVLRGADYAVGGTDDSRLEVLRQRSDCTA